MKNLKLILALGLSCSVAQASFIIPDNAVTTGKIKNQNVTQAKLQARATGTTVSAGGVAVSLSSGNFSTTSTSFVDVTNLSVTITTTGRPVMILLMPDGSGTPGYLVTQHLGSSFAVSNFRILRGATEIMQSVLSSNTVSGTGNTEIDIPPGLVYGVDFVSAGTYTYKLQADATSGVTTFVKNTLLVAYEL